MNPIARALAIAAKRTDRNPSEAQKEAGNYKKAKVTVAPGLVVAIENPKGSERRGTDATGKKWRCTLPSHYGYLLGSVGADKDHVDCYIGSDHDSQTVYVVDQVDAKTGAFDEHKCCLNYKDKDSAVADYIKAFADGKGKDRIGSVTEMPLDAFRAWLKAGNTKKPLGMKGYASGGAVTDILNDNYGDDDERPDKKVAYRASMLPVGTYEDGTTAFPVKPQGWLDLVDSWKQFGRAAEQSRGAAAYPPEETFPRDKDAILAGAAMAGAGALRFPVAAAESRLAGSVAGAERAGASGGLPSSPVAAGSHPAEGSMRLYRGENEGGMFGSEQGGRWFTTDRRQAQSYVKDGELKYVDVPANDDALAKMGVHRNQDNPAEYIIENPSIRAQASDASGLPSHIGEAGRPFPIEQISAGEQHPGPVLAHHGTDRAFKRFDIDKSRDIGIHFGTEDQAATRAGQVSRSSASTGLPARTIPSVINADKVVTLPDMRWHLPDEVARHLEEVDPVGLRGISQQIAPLLQNKPKAFQAIRDRLAGAGYDGIRYQNFGTEGDGWSYIATRPGTVKHATTGETLFSNAPDAAPVGALAMGAAGRQHLVDASLPADHIVNSVPNRLIRINQQLYDNMRTIKEHPDWTTRAKAEEQRGRLLMARREIQRMANEGEGSLYGNPPEGSGVGAIAMDAASGNGPIRAYHGAKQPYAGDVYDPKKSQYRAFFAAEDPKFAGQFARDFYDAPRVYPVDISPDAKLFDFRNAEHTTKLADAVEKNPAILANNYLVGPQSIRKWIMEGDAGILEDAGIQKWLKQNKYDGWKFEDTAATGDNRTSYGMLRPGHVKSAMTGDTIFSNPSSPTGLLPMGSGKEPTDRLDLPYQISELLRQPYPSEESYFAANPNVAGMATEDNRIILNQHSKTDDLGKRSVAHNEAARIQMRDPNFAPNFDLTDEQSKRFANYGAPQDQRATVAARILAGDTSAGAATPEQSKFANGLASYMGVAPATGLQPLGLLPMAGGGEEGDDPVRDLLEKHYGDTVSKRGWLKRAAGGLVDLVGRSFSLEAPKPDPEDFEKTLDSYAPLKNFQTYGEAELRGTGPGESRSPTRLMGYDEGERPTEYLTPAYEGASPAVGGYGMGQGVGDVATKMLEGEYGDAAWAAIPLAIGAMVPGPDGVGMRAREIDARGFYSPSLEASKGLPQQTGTVQQMTAMLLKAGAKPKELDAVGFHKAFPDPNAKVSRADIEQYLRDNRVQLGSETLGILTPEQIKARNRGDADAVEIDGPAKFESYSTPGGIPGSYREVVTTLPPAKSAAQRAFDNARTRGDRSESDLEAMMEKANEGNYTSSHWPGITNPLLHYRQKDFLNHADPTSVGALEKVTQPGEFAIKAYHGTNQPIESFDPARFGSATASATSREGVWFTDSPEVAGMYADNAANRVVANVADHERQFADLTQKIAQAERRGDWDTAEALTHQIEALDIGAIRAPPTGQNIIPANLRMRNPKTYDMKGQQAPSNFDQMIADAKAAGHDGVVFKDIADDPTGSLTTSTHYLVFNPEDIRSPLPQSGSGEGTTSGGAFRSPESNLPSKTRVLDEMQSDWAQRARDNGIRSAPDPAWQTRLEAATKELDDLRASRASKRETQAELDANSVRQLGLVNELLDLQNKIRSSQEGVPSAPYISNTSDWVDLGLKQALIDAAKDPSVNRLAWAPGKVQADRYDMGRHADAFRYNPERNSFQYRPPGQDQWSMMPGSREVTPQQLPEVIGKELAERLLAQPRGHDPSLAGLDGNGWHTLETAGQHIGGAGHKAFYGDMTPEGYQSGIVGTRLQKLVKGLDPDAARVEPSRIDTNKSGWHITPPDRTAHGKWMVKSSDYNSKGLRFDTEAEAKAALREKMEHESYPSVPVTPAMREKILKEGLPLFLTPLGLGMAAEGMGGEEVDPVHQLLQDHYGDDS